MTFRATIRRRWALVLLAGLPWAPAGSSAGGGPFNTLVVVNTNSADSVELGEYYAAAHGIPAHHVCRLGLATNLVSVTSNEFQTLLRGPITNGIATNGLAGQIDCVVLSWDFPTRIRNANNYDVESVTAALFYGFKNAPGVWDPPYGTCKLAAGTSNAYHRAERAFRSAAAWNGTNGFIAFHLVAFDLAAAKRVVDRGVAARSAAPPPATFNLHMLGDQRRGIREQRFAQAQFAFAALPGLPAQCHFPPRYQILSGRTNVMGYHDGFANVRDPLLNDLRTNNVWLPGAFADSLTSYGGRIENFTNGLFQSTVLDWLDIGATASYGTVDEPCAYFEKFPDPLMAFYYARGFTLGEAYVQSVEAPYQGLFAGDPLAAPFAAPAAISVAVPAPDQIVAGTVPVQVSAGAGSNGVPAAAIDLYLDGRFHANLASLGPTPGNVLAVAVAGLTNSATVETNHSLFDAVAALAAAVNADSNQIVAATAMGDRLELIYKQFNHAGDHAPVSATVAPGSGSVLTLGVGLAATHLVPSIYPARKNIVLEDQPWNSGANTGDTLTCTITLTNGTAVTNVIVARQGEARLFVLERLMAAINANATLMATNGVRYDRLALSFGEVVDSGALFARTPGPDGAGIQVDFTVVPVSTNSGLTTNYNFSAFLDDYADDLRARASVLFHVQPTNGVLEAEMALDTTLLADGLHVLDFIARDGSAVAAQSRFTLPLVVGNSSPQLSLLGTNGTAVTNNEPAALAKGTDFGALEWGQTTSHVFAIANAGPVPLAIAGWTTNGSGTAALQIADVPATVEAGGVSNFTVSFSPAATGLFQASLSFDSDAIVDQTNLLFAGTGAPRHQTIDFPPAVDQHITNVLGLSATASSGLPVEFAVVSGPAQITEATNLSFTGTGVVAVAAAQAGDANWNPAPGVTNQLGVYGLHALTVLSAYGAAHPPVGIHTQLLDTVLTNSVVPPEPAGGTQLVCTGWTLDGHEPAGGTGAVFTMTVTNDATLTWLWTTNYWLAVAAGLHGSVDVSNSWQAAGSATQLTATADAHYHFAGWSGSVSETDNPLELLMAAPQSVQANFAENLAANGTPEWWLAQHGWTNDFDAAATNDAEPDGYPTWQEYVADTDPNDTGSFPRVAAIAADGAHAVVTWPASTGRSYQIHLADDLVTGPWITQQLALGAGEWTDTNPPPATSRYYRIAPQLP